MRRRDWQGQVRDAIVLATKVSRFIKNLPREAASGVGTTLSRVGTAALPSTSRGRFFISVSSDCSVNGYPGDHPLEIAVNMQDKTKIFLRLAVALGVVLALVFLLKAPSRESAVDEAPQAGEDLTVNSLAAFNLSHVKYHETEAKNRVAACISRRYKITLDAARKITELAQQVAAQHNLDPNLILAIIANESKFHPLLVSPVGALGLMQIMPNVHKRKLAAYGGENAALNPEVNMLVGAGIISSFIRQTGSLDGGLAMYVGAGFDTSHPYVYKVKYELEVFRDCARGITRSTFDPSGPRAAKSGAYESEAESSAVAADAEK